MNINKDTKMLNTRRKSNYLRHPPPPTLKMPSPYFLLTLFMTTFILVSGQCPWPRNPQHASLHSDCVCGYSNVRRLSVQCSPVANFSLLLAVLHSSSVRRLPIDLLYINNATDRSNPNGLRLPKNAFRGLDIQQIHLANSRLDTVERGAFSGLEETLLSLTLQGTGLRELPVTEFAPLRALRTLDLTGNRLRRVRAAAFADLERLATLRLAFNADLELDALAFVGLERSLKNLNLKAIGARTIPEAIRNLTELAFLDLAQNEIEEIAPRRFYFANLHSLTALSLERNRLRTLHADTFIGLNDSLSSLSLLNNALVEAPVKALAKLTGLRVLDLGFNAIRQLPPIAFRSNTLLTLLALDGNPLKTLPLTTFAHLNQTLRGLSVGGKAFECDCKVRWLAEWAQAYNLQITSRERNPQFCAKPAHLRSKQPFTHVDLNDFVCAPGAELPVSTTSTTTTKSPTTHHIHLPPEVHYEPSVILPEVISTNPNLIITSPKSTTTKAPSTTTSPPTTTKPTVVYRPSPPSPPATSYVQVVTVDENDESSEAKNVFRTAHPLTTTTTTSTTTQSKTPKIVNQKISTTSSPKSNLVEETPPKGVVTEIEQPIIKTNKGRQRVVSSVTAVSPSDSHIITQSSPANSQLRLLEATYRNNSITLRWEHPGTRSSKTGYTVLYRYFGSKEYHKSEAVIPPSATTYLLPEYISANELLVICVLPIDNPKTSETEDKPPETSTIPIAQCKELTTREPPPPIIKKNSPVRNPSLPTGSTTSATFSSLYPSLKRLNDLDKLVIAVSAAVCLFIVLAVLVFSCCFYRSVNRDSSRPLRAVLAATSKSLSPMTKSSSLGLGGGDWEETVSVYSTRSIPRARIAQHLRGPPPIPPPAITGTIRSHISAHQNHQNQPPLTRSYFGSTLPNTGKGGGRNNAAGSWVLNADPLNTTAFYPAAVSYGTTVTATGGGGAVGNGAYSFDNAYLRNSIGRELLSPMPPPLDDHSHLQPQHYRSARYQGAHNSSSSSSNANANSRSNHRNRKSTSKSRSVKSGSHHHQLPQPELRIQPHHATSTVNNINNNIGGSYNRLLLSSSSNSFQSNTNTTEYYDDSDHWNSNGGGGYGRSIGTTTTNSRMNDNEVDIYVDQNYARRFI